MERIWIPAFIFLIISIHAEMFYYLAQQTKYTTQYMFIITNVWKYLRKGLIDHSSYYSPEDRIHLKTNQIANM